MTFLLGLVFISSIVSRLGDDAQGFDCLIVAEITGLVVVQAKLLE